MIGDWLRKLFGASPQGGTVRPSESVKAEHAEFCRTFCHQPGVKFMDYLKAEGVTRLIDWLDPSSPDPVSRAFIHLAVDGTRQGQKFWDKPGISMYFDSGSAQGGPPGRVSQDALSVLAQALGKPIKLYYKDTPDGPYMVMEFQPTKPRDSDDASPSV